MAFGLSRFDLTTLTRRLELPEISADPTHPLTLILRFMGIGNRDWEAWRFARDAAAPETDIKKPTAQRIAENRADARDSISAIALTGWENVLEDGVATQFSSQAAQRFMAELHDMVPAALAKIADFASTRSNFRTEPAPNPVDLGKE